MSLQSSDAPSMQPHALASRSTVYGLFRTQARIHPDAPAIESRSRRWTYQEVLVAVDRLASGLRAQGVVSGERIAVLSENRVEYLLLQLAASRLGAIVACLNWRLATEELQHCVDLADPKLLFSSERFDATAASLRAGAYQQRPLGECLDELARHPPDDAEAVQDSELGFLLLYTSGTTGLPKAALISQRAEVSRMTVLRMDLSLGPEHAYLAWSPMFHMGGTEHSLASLMFGAQVIITDGFDLPAMLEAIATTKLGWLLLIPSTIESLLDALDTAQTAVKGVKVVGCMADLVPPALIARLTRRLNAPFLNSFGATETGLAPLTGHLIPIGEAPSDLSKRLSSLCEFRIVDPDDREVAEGATGEAVVRGPTLFSGYWNAAEVNAVDFRGGWFHMGDLFRRSPSGGFEFVGRSKYLIKSGGENIYPAEIERVLLGDPRIGEAAVVRKPDARWGEIPVAFIAAIDQSLQASDIESLCRERLAGYKRPREVYFIPPHEFPRSATGKILREALERRLLNSEDIAWRLSHGT
jgi:fatty-acyl-CoA synthase